MLIVTEIDKTVTKAIEKDKTNISLESIKSEIKNIKRARYSSIKVSDISKKYITPKSILPFRVSFESVGVSNYGPGNPAPIGIAIIGLNNYIL